MKRFMVFVVSLAFLFCASAFAAEKAMDTKSEPAAADTAKPEKAKKEKKAKKATKAKKEKKEKKAEEAPAEAPAK